MNPSNGSATRLEPETLLVLPDPLRRCTHRRHVVCRVFQSFPARRRNQQHRFDQNCSIITLEMEIPESRDRLGYCDIHLASPLVPHGTWLAGQYGGDMADCNPLEFWRCSRTECSRCYEPYMFGYCNLDRHPGAHIQANPRTQEKCGHHDRLPFMVIGRFAQCRRFRCPFQGCDKVGSLVAEHVADPDDVEDPQSVNIALTGNAKKEAFELSVFEEFANEAHLVVESPESAKPPHPDIRCLIDGEEYWFELGRITDTTLAKAISIQWPTTPQSFSFAQKEPFVRIIGKKAEAHYETNGRQVDLLLHFDQQPPDRTALARHLQEQTDALNDLHQHGPFTRIWIYDKWSKSVLWQSG